VFESWREGWNTRTYSLVGHGGTGEGAGERKVSSEARERRQEGERVRTHDPIWSFSKGSSISLRLARSRTEQKNMEIMSISSVLKIVPPCTHYQ